MLGDRLALVKNGPSWRETCEKALSTEERCDIIKKISALCPWHRASKTLSILSDDRLFCYSQQAPFHHTLSVCEQGNPQ
jgi:hypothetical protein